MSSIVCPFLPTVSLESSILPLISCMYSSNHVNMDCHSCSAHESMVTCFEYSSCIFCKKKNTSWLASFSYSIYKDIVCLLLVLSSIHEYITDLFWGLYQASTKTRLVGWLCQSIKHIWRNTILSSFIKHQLSLGCHLLS